MKQQTNTTPQDKLLLEGRQAETGVTSQSSPLPGIEPLPASLRICGASMTPEQREEFREHMQRQSAAISAHVEQSLTPERLDKSWEILSGRVSGHTREQFEREAAPLRLLENAARFYSNQVITENRKLDAKHPCPTIACFEIQGHTIHVKTGAEFAEPYRNPPTLAERALSFFLSNQPTIYIDGKKVPPAYKSEGKGVINLIFRAAASTFGREFQPSPGLATAIADHIFSEAEAVGTIKV